MKEAYLFTKLKDQKVQCQNCSHYCLIEDGKRGKCGVRENQNGKLYALNYGKVIALAVDPIEKKPLYHFLPGTFSLSLATVGCNFACWNCQNWQISQAPQLSGIIEGEEIAPEKIARMAKEGKFPSISYTYTEPAIFSEYALDIMKLAKKQGIKNVWVSNGFWSKELFDLIIPYLDATNIDLKGFTPAPNGGRALKAPSSAKPTPIMVRGFTEDFYQKYCGARLQPVLETLKRLKQKNVHTEITTLVIPTLNDSEETFRGIAEFIAKELGKEVPWHISRFSGAISWKLRHTPDTPIETLKKAYQIGKDAGLKYVHIGNVLGLLGDISVNT